MAEATRHMRDVRLLSVFINQNRDWTSSIRGNVKKVEVLGGAQDYQLYATILTSYNKKFLGFGFRGVQGITGYLGR